MPFTAPAETTGAESKDSGIVVHPSHPAKSTFSVPARLAVALTASDSVEGVGHSPLAHATFTYSLDAERAVNVPARAAQSVFTEP